MSRASYDVIVSPADNGCIVRVGCKVLVFTEKEEPKMLELLRRYLNGEEDKLRRELFPEEFVSETQTEPHIPELGHRLNAQTRGIPESSIAPVYGSLHPGDDVLI